MMQWWKSWIEKAAARLATPEDPLLELLEVVESRRKLMGSDWHPAAVKIVFAPNGPYERFLHPPEDHILRQTIAHVLRRAGAVPRVSLSFDDRLTGSQVELREPSEAGSPVDSVSQPVSSLWKEPSPFGTLPADAPWFSEAPLQGGPWPPGFGAPTEPGFTPPKAGQIGGDWEVQVMEIPMPRRPPVLDPMMHIPRRQAARSPSRQRETTRRPSNRGSTPPWPDRGGSSKEATDPDRGAESGKRGRRNSQ